MILICIALFLMPFGAWADDRLVRLAVPQELVQSGLFKHILPRFSIIAIINTSWQSCRCQVKRMISIKLCACVGEFIYRRFKRMDNRIHTCPNCKIMRE